MTRPSRDSVQRWAWWLLLALFYVLVLAIVIADRLDIQVIVATIVATIVLAISRPPRRR